MGADPLSPRQDKVSLGYSGEVGSFLSKSDVGQVEVVSRAASSSEEVRVDIPSSVFQSGRAFVDESL